MFHGMVCRSPSPYNRVMRRNFPVVVFAFGLFVEQACARSGRAPAFDLIGPKVDVHVKRGEVTLPIGQVPNLLPGTGYGSIRTFRRASRRTMC